MRLQGSCVCEISLLLTPVEPDPYGTFFVPLVPHPAGWRKQIWKVAHLIVRMLSTLLASGVLP